jgi:branched-chain amino acid transport system substrate-binding protein
MIRRLGHEVYCVGSDYIWTWETNRVFREIVRAAGGRLLAERLVPLGGCGARALVPEILAKPPPIVLNTLVGAASYEFLRAFHAAFESAPNRRRPVVVSCSLCEPELRLVGGAAAVGHITSSVYFSAIDTPENRRFVRRWRMRFGARSAPSVDAEASYLCGTLLARAIRRSGGGEVDVVKRAVYLDEFAAPQGKVRVDPDNNHCFLTPRLGRSVEGETFEIIEEAPGPVKPDPFLAWTDIEELAGDGAGRRVAGLRVVK